GRLNARRSYVSNHIHLVFSTKQRRKLITPALRERLWPFMGGIARQNKMKAIEIGGIEDHVHLLLSLPATLSIAKAAQLIKGGSSKWVHDTFPEHRLFQWQEKYGSFKVSVSQLDTLIRYIRKQEQHHRYNVPRGIPGVAEEAPDRIRRAISVGLSSAVPSGLASFPRVPGSELPGYYRQSLRDLSPISAPKMSKLQRGVYAASLSFLAQLSLNSNLLGSFTLKRPDRRRADSPPRSALAKQGAVL